MKTIICNSNTLKHVKIIIRRYATVCRISSVLVLAAMCTSSCNYLDIVPDNISTVDHAFRSRNEAEGFLYGCFSFLPNFAEAADNPALLGGDEVWYIDPVNGISPRLWYIARGNQGTNAPLADYWASTQNGYNLNGGKAIFTALSDCNIFLENIHKPFDLDESERVRWIAEIKFLKAYLHFWLFRMYGPIPLIKENIPVSEKGEAVMRRRESIDEIVEYIVSLLDEAHENLPPVIELQITEAGRPTQAIALALKAQVLTYAASPLFNGTATEPPPFSLIDNRGINLFPQTYSPEKWQRAAEAMKTAIDFAHENGYKLYDFREVNPVLASSLSDSTINSMQVRGAATERINNPEIMWGDYNSNTDALQYACFQRMMGGNSFSQRTSWAPPLHIVEQFYTDNGVPIEEDKDWAGRDPMELRMATNDDRLYIKPAQQTLQLHFNREPRFYASITFEHGRFFGNGRVTDGTSSTSLWYTTRPGGQIEMRSSTGYLCKKLLSYMTAATNGDATPATSRYPFPLMRLADLYLMYAEALNEAGGDTPAADVYKYVDTVRKRSGLKGVVEAWHDHATVSQQNKPLTKDGMREIIRRERMIELAFEGIRFWDLKRWKLAEEYMNRTVRGFDLFAEDFYQPVDIFQLKFEKKDYFWPIRQSILLNNKNLMQNPGW
ncbi:MAG: RagB/SusD family nutrient uptake outer membrane protein [Tannerella sp.]|jgi:hypothetical protein|nr:RagB/SusD family nutrient uptake outer membrane protein [Tannerella sp.]